LFTAKETLAGSPSHRVVHGVIRRDSETLDDVLVTVFRAPHSFTGEDTVEIACHGSRYIQQQLMLWLIESGAQQARPGEFTLRAFLNGKMDLSQAEAVADLIASTSSVMHRLALNQMRGGFSGELKQLRAQLLDFLSLIELELDFSDHEDLVFADRSELRTLALRIQSKIAGLTDSFATGNAIKNGIPVAIIGKPNVGKSTLLNALLNEERAIVTAIPGTTRDTIEETLYMQGQLFRFIDTAGLREHTTDPIEALGIQRSFEKAGKASLILYLFDLTQEGLEDMAPTRQWLRQFDKPILMIGTKNDVARRDPPDTSGKEITNRHPNETAENIPAMYISCKEATDIESVKQSIVQLANIQKVSDNDVIVTNIRHYEALCRAGEAINRVLEGLDIDLSGDLLAQDIRECQHYLGEITGGEIATGEILGNIFSKFCIGK
jgi:tRNA modification GTPase